MNACEQYPDDEEYGDEEYEYEDDDEGEQVYATSTEFSEQPIFANAEQFLKNPELYPKNQKDGLDWEQDPWEDYEVDESLIHSLNHSFHEKYMMNAISIPKPPPAFTGDPNVYQGEILGTLDENGTITKSTYMI